MQHSAECIAEQQVTEIGKKKNLFTLWPSVEKGEMLSGHETNRLLWYEKLSLFKKGLSHSYD